MPIIRYEADGRGAAGRQAVFCVYLLLACAALALCVVCALSGCSSNSDIPLTETEGMGLNLDTKDPAGQKMTIKLYADERVKDLFPFDSAIERYTEGDTRKNMTIDVNFVSEKRVQQMAHEGSEDGDALIGEEGLIEQADDDGILEGGRVHTSLRTVPLYAYFIRLIKKKGADVSKLTTTMEGISEKHDPENGMWINGLPTFKGTLGIAAEGTLEGDMARSLLAKYDFYTSESGQGGKFVSSLDDIIVEYADAKAVAAAVRKGDCDLGLIGQWQANRIKGIENMEVPMASMGRTRFSAGSFTASEKGAYARDFLEWMVIMG